MKRYYSLSVLAGLTAAAAIFPATAAQAAEQLPLAPLCAEQKDVTGPQYAVNLCDVTDVDQFRTNLAAKGNSHCGPASLYNAMFYLGEHKGLPMRVTPNGQLLTEYDPAVPADYDAVTAWLGWLGYKAGMDPDGGSTTRAGNRAAFDAATVGAKASGWTVNRGGTDTDDVPEFGLEIAKRLKQAPVQLSYGRYVLNADKTHTRTGGHAVTVVAAKGDVASGKVELTLHDPGRAADHKSPGYLDTQSATRDPRREGHALPGGDQREVDAGGPERGADNQAAHLLAALRRELRGRNPPVRRGDQLVRGSAAGRLTLTQHP